MPETLFTFSYKLPIPPSHNNFNKVYTSGDLRTVISPELRTKYQVTDYGKFEGSKLFDGTPFKVFIEEYKEAFEFGAYEGYWFIDTCGYFDGPDKEWERLNTYHYIVLRWKEIHHHGFLSGYEETVNFVKWIFTIKQFLNMFPDNPRIINDYVEYLRMTKEPIKAFKIAIELYEKYQVGDFYINLNYCYWDILELYEGPFIERQEL
jgi:hypothetical protein